MQEFRAAKDCILQAFPGATVREDRVDEYPIHVYIFGPDGAEVWSGCQKGLFAKYGWRARGEIERALAELKLGGKRN